ncbi:MAG: glycoside hydrolase family 78 protein [Oscillospiraceae bacterium]|jgi:alpha-L-rhamnosidase|nr:glycoside hydrolase family 78 protein [Oscillospiraceae bacterium]
MLSISDIKLNGLRQGLVTDAPPALSFALSSDVPGESLKSAVLRSGDWRCETRAQVGNGYGGALAPFTEYAINIEATGTSGETAAGTVAFQTGRLDMPWQGRWITHGSYAFKEGSPTPMTFRKGFAAKPGIKRAWVCATALGIYELSLNGAKVGEDYFAPGLTSYGHQIQYQVYDVTERLHFDNTLTAVVAGGWACGSFTYGRKNKISADKQAFLLELWVEYESGAREVLVASDASWQTTMDGHYRMAEWYDGETYDATVNLSQADWQPCALTAPRRKPKLIAQYGDAVRAQQTLQPISRIQAPSGEWIYDFGQNFSGVISAKLQGKTGQQVTFRHAEVLVDGELFVKSLRTAKATAIYICRDGEQSYAPRLTYMGFRYVGISGIAPEDLELFALVLHSDFEEIGSFTCSNPLLNQLQSNIRWGGKSNFVDIPTDCPQRDERQGWTGDIAVFASTACYNFDLSRFLGKWLLDMRAEQGRGGGIPMVIPKAGDGWPTMATSCWGDSCVLVPWAEYLARGDERLLAQQYPTIQRFLKAAKWWSAFLAFTPSGRHIWRFPFHFGDWCAPGETAKQWIQKGKWVGTAYFANSCAIAARMAQLLGKPEDAAYYQKLRKKIIKAYRKVFTDGKGKLKKEFQTGYVLPLYFGMTEGEETRAMANHLARLVREADGHLTTGFTGTPYLLFALSDNGHAKKAFDLLLQEDCPGWLYEVVTGGTTIWERWDALRPDGTVNIGDLQGSRRDEDSGGGMVSFNHYANGAVGDWLYRRILGIEPTGGGYKTFSVAPLVGGGITFAKGSVRTPYGVVAVDWRIAGDVFIIDVQVPISTQCQLTLPDGQAHTLGSGSHQFSCGKAIP